MKLKPLLETRDLSGMAKMVWKGDTFAKHWADAEDAAHRLWDKKLLLADLNRTPPSQRGGWKKREMPGDKPSPDWFFNIVSADDEKGGAVVDIDKGFIYLTVTCSYGHTASDGDGIRIVKYHIDSKTAEVIYHPLDFKAYIKKHAPNALDLSTLHDE